MGFICGPFPLFRGSKLLVVLWKAVIFISWLVMWSELYCQRFHRILNLGLAISDQSQQDDGPFSPVISKRGFGIGSVFRKAASVASVAAKHAYAAAAASSTSDDEMLPLKCCLMSISLPWEHIAYDLLFKVRSLICSCSWMKRGSFLGNGTLFCCFHPVEFTR